MRIISNYCILNMQIFLWHMYLIYIQWVQAKIVHDIIYCLLTNNSSIVAISYISKKVNKIEILHENSTDILGVYRLQNFFLGQCSHSAISDFCVGSLQIYFNIIYQFWKFCCFLFATRKHWGMNFAGNSVKGRHPSW